MTRTNLNPDCRWQSGSQFANWLILYFRHWRKCKSSPISSTIKVHPIGWAFFIFTGTIPRHRLPLRGWCFAQQIKIQKLPGAISQSVVVLCAANQNPKIAGGNFTICGGAERSEAERGCHTLRYMSSSGIAFHPLSGRHRPATNSHGAGQLSMGRAVPGDAVSELFIPSPSRLAPCHLSRGERLGCAPQKRYRERPMV